MVDLDDLFEGFDAAEKRSSGGSAKKRPPVLQQQPSSKKKKATGKAQVIVTETKKTTTDEGRSMTSFSVFPVDYVEQSVTIHEKPAKEYSFALDPFQKAATEYVEADESVLVAAHTSAGKTVVAEYAIAKCFRDNQRVIYTSPIKALSNQKFRDLQSEFEDVGLLTGDVSINPTAKCLVMTTEILRSMLYRGSELCREVKWVIFDEIHYMRDAERGVVWEESIVLLPHSVRLVFLSATIPNAAQFASWIATIHRQPCHVVYTDFRPTPLVHYAFAGNGLHLVVDENSAFKPENFDRALASLSATTSKKDNDPPLKAILAHVHAAELQPCIVFAFSKAKCEKNLQSLKEARYNDEHESALVRQIYAAAMTSLGEEDRKLPQVAALVSVLERGVGIHHGGLLPLVKEVVEILFQEGLIKVLFATETFAIGVNMPAKSVVFTELRKFDGSEFRTLSPSEYIQMSGRAGRRGKDERGTVILVLEDDDAASTENLKDTLRGQSEALDSSYHVTYNMLLNLLRVEGADPEYLVRSSFRQFQRDAIVPDLLAQAEELEAASDAVELPAGEESAAKMLAGLEDQLEIKRDDVSATFYQPAVIAPWLQPGRLVEIDKEWVAIASHKPPNVSYIHPKTTELRSSPVSAVRRLSAVRVFAPPDPRKPEARRAASDAVMEVIKRFSGGDSPMPLLDDEDDLKIKKDEKLTLLRSQIESLEKAIAEQSAARGTVPAYRARAALISRAQDKRREAREAQKVVLKDELGKMRRVLRRLEHVGQDGVIAAKGRAACELNTSDELVAAQLLLGGAFTELQAPEIAALLSCLVYASQGKSDGGGAKQKKVPMRPRLEKAKDLLVAAAKEVYQAKRDSNIDIDEAEYVESFNPDMMSLVFEWANGAKFVDLTKLTDAYEGTVVRVIRRLDELIRQLSSAAHAIGNFELKEKMDAASTSIKRDIVFAASLYL